MSVAAFGRRIDLDRQLLLRSLIIAAALWLTVWMASARAPQVLPVAAVVGIGALIALVRWPSLGLGLLVVGTVWVPFGLGTGTETTINIAIALVGVLSGLWILEGALLRDLRFFASRPNRPLLLLLGISVVALVNGTQPWIAYAQTASLASQLGGFAIYALSACAFLLTANRVQDERLLRRLTWIFVAAGALVVLDRLVTLPLPMLKSAYYVVGTGSMFWLCLITLAFSQALLNRDLAMRWRLALAILVVAYMWFALLKNRDWTSGWAPELVMMVVVLWVGARRAAFVFLAACVPVLALKWTAIADLLFYSNAKNQYDVLTRTAAWDIVGSIIKLNPILGVGFSNYYQYTPLFPILGYSVKFVSHNNYMDLLAQTGVLGLIAFVWFFGEVWFLAWRLRTRVAPGFARAYVCGIVGAVPAMLLAAFMGDWVLPFVYNVGMAGFRASVLAWLFLGGLLVLERQMGAEA
jgi:O-antigen ligase